MGSYKKNIMSNVVTKILKFILSLGVSVIIARVLGPEGKGVAAYIIMIISMFALIGPFGILDAHSYFFAKKIKRKKEKIFQNNMTFIILISLILILIVLLISLKGYLLNNSLNFLNNPFYSLFILFGILILMISPVLSQTLFVLNKIFLENKILLINRIAFLVILSSLMILNKLTILSYLFTYFLFELILAIIYFINIKIPFRIYLNKNLIKEEFKFGFPLFIGVILINLVYKVDIFFIQYFLGFVETGVYSVGVNIAQKIWLIPVSIGAVLYAKLLNTQNKIKKKNITILTSKFSFFICLFLVLPLLVLAPWIVMILYGVAYEKSATIIQLLLPGVLFNLIGILLYTYYKAKGQPSTYVILTFITFLINLILNIILIPKLGINGAAIASTLSYTAFGLSYLILITRKEKKHSFFHFFWLNKEEWIIIQDFLPSQVKRILTKLK
jgi:O-antigen/teichoic acid export membrane protein